MLSSMLLDGRLGPAALVVLALLEAWAALWAAHRVGQLLEPTFLRRRVGLAVVFIAGLGLYGWLRAAYLADLYFHALYTFIISFAVFYYVCGIAASLVSGLFPASAEQGADAPLFAMAGFVLLGTVIMRPQTATFGAFVGALVHLMRAVAGRRARRFTWWFLAVLTLVLVLYLSLVYG